ncbi:MAG: CDP-alcohol phosphatidyltransferase family protein [Sulfolobales archaeon]
MREILARFREKLKKVIRPIAITIAETGISPNIVTIAGFIVAALTPIATIYMLYIGYIICVLLSSTLDALDGEIARVRGRVSKLGAFLDSFLDRVSDVFYIYSLTFLGLDSTIVVTLIVLSILISYSRARAEGLGVAVEGVGLMERGERVIALIIIVAISYFYKDLLLIGSLLLIVLLLYTLLERVYYIMRKLVT